LLEARAFVGLSRGEADAHLLENVWPADYDAALPG
jgi:hypothetical protein